VIQVTLPIPPSVNQIWRCQGNKIRKSRNYRLWQSAASLAAMTTAIPRPAFAKPVAVEMVVRTGHGWRSNRDLDNICKPVLDWLVMWGILASDDCSVVRSVLITIDTLPRAVACVDVTIRPLA